MMTIRRVVSYRASESSVLSIFSAFWINNEVRWRTEKGSGT